MSSTPPPPPKSSPWSDALSEYFREDERQQRRARGDNSTDNILRSLDRHEGQATVAELRTDTKLRLTEIGRLLNNLVHDGRVAVRGKPGEELVVRLR